MAGERALMVEGIDDEHVLKHICGNRGLPELDEIKPYGGYSGVLNAIPTRVEFANEADIIGIVVDANSDPVDRWQAISAKLDQANYRDLPIVPEPPGDNHSIFL